MGVSHRKTRRKDKFYRTFEEVRLKIDPLNPENPVLIHTVFGKWAIITVAGQGCVSALSVRNPGGGPLENRVSPALCQALGTYLICKSTLYYFKLHSSLELICVRHGRAAPNQKCQPGTSLRILCVSAWLCRPSLPSRGSYVSVCRKAAFPPLPLRRDPGWAQNVRGVVRHTGRQQGRKGGRVRAESWPGCDGHQIWERSSPGRVKEGGGRV